MKISFYRFNKVTGLAATVSLVIIVFIGIRLGFANADNGYTVSGQVTLSSGPLNAGYVSLTGTSGNNPSGSTDTNGNYSFSNVPSANYGVTVGGNENSGQPSFSAISNNNYVTVNSNDVTKNIAFSTDALKVTVKDSDGDPISGASISAASSGNSTQYTSDGQPYNVYAVSASGTTDSSGALTINVFPGLSYQLCTTNSANNGSYCNEVTVNTNNSTTEIDLPAGHMVAGQVTINSIPVSVGLGISGGITSLNTNTDASGNYSFNDVPNDTYGVEMGGNERNGLPGFSATSNNNYITVNDSDLTQDIGFSTDSLAVSVKDGNGNPISEISVHAASSGNSTQYTSDGQPYNVYAVTNDGTTGSDGTVTLNVFPGLPYQVCGINPANNSTYCNNVTVNSNGTATEIDIPNGYTVSGQTSLDSHPLSTEATLSWSDGNSSSVYSDSNGNYNFNDIPNGNYSISVSGSNGTSTSPEFSATSNNSYVTVNNGSISNQNISFSTTPLVTTIKDENGNPVAGIPVQIVSTDTRTIDSNNGQPFTVSGLNIINATTVGTGAATARVFSGLSYSVCATDPTNNFEYCNNPVNVPPGGSTNEIDFPTTVSTPPAITSNSALNATFGNSFNFTVTTTGNPAPNLTKMGGLPSGVTFTDNGNGTGTLSGTPANSALGTYAFNIKAKNSSGSTTQSFSLTVDKSPVIQNLPSTSTAQAEAPYSLTIKTSAFPTANITESGSLPTGLTFSDNGDGTAALEGTPATGSGGSYPITITAYNGQASTSQTLTLKVGEGPDITSINSATVSSGSPLSFQVTATGYPIPTISESGALPKGLSYRRSTGTLSGTPATGTQGTYYLTFTAKNSAGTNSQAFTLTVQ